MNSLEADIFAYTQFPGNFLMPKSASLIGKILESQPEFVKEKYIFFQNALQVGPRLEDFKTSRVHASFVLKHGSTPGISLMGE